MKKKILTSMALLGLIGFTTAQAQSTDASFGIKGGANFSNLYVDDVDDNNVLAGFNLGVFVNMPLNEAVSIQPEFLYSQKELNWLMTMLWQLEKLNSDSIT